MMQNDYYWLEVTSCLFFRPHEAHRCRACEECCAELSLGSLPLRRTEGLSGRNAALLNTHCKEKDALQIERRQHAKNRAVIHNADERRKK